MVAALASVDRVGRSEQVALAWREEQGGRISEETSKREIPQETYRHIATDKEVDLDVRAGWLLRAVALGHTDAFWGLWEIYKDDLFKLCLRTMSGVRADAEDALSMAMLRARDRLPAYAADIHNVRGWLGKLTLNLCVDMHRERKQESLCLEALALTCDRKGRSDSPSPEAGVIHSQVVRRLNAAVNSLPPRLSEPLRLRFTFDETYKAIGSKLGIPAPQVRRQIDQALLALRARLLRLE